MDIYSATDYREFISENLRSETNKSRGTAKRLAEVMKCHSTYVSQIIKGKADLSTEQAIAYCHHMGLGREEIDHFMDLLGQAKAGTKEVRAYFDERLQSRLANRVDLKQRLTVTDGLSLDQQLLYYDGWLPQLIHVSIQIPGAQTADAIAQLLRLDKAKVEEVLRLLESIHLIEYRDGIVTPLRGSVFLGSDSPLLRRFHANWRSHVTNELLTTANSDGMHYSSVLTMSKETAREFRELAIRHVSETREIVFPSPSEEIYVYCLDFYPITDTDQSKK